MANYNLLNRPKFGEDEEELLRMQEEFVHSQEKPSASIINTGQTTNDENKSILNNTNEIQSTVPEFKRFKSEKKEISTSQPSKNVLNLERNKSLDDATSKKLEDFVQNIPEEISPVIIGNIVERKHNKFEIEDKSNKFSSDLGFPRVFKLDYTESNSKQSLFRRKISKLKAGEQLVTPLEIKPLVKQLDKESISAQKIMIDAMKNEVDEENRKKLKQLSEKEILEEKQQLENSMDLKLLEFIKNRKRKVKNLEENRNMETDNAPTNMEIANEENQIDGFIEEANKNTLGDISNNLPATSAQILSEAKEKGYVHMNTIEPEKMKWMEDISSNENIQLNEPYNARFDFDGILLPYKDENLSVDKGLHHHGEEPERPGYTLQELLQLSRSSIQQQRCTALNMLGNVMEKSRRGWYDNVLQPAPLIALSQRNILLLLRFSIDDSSGAVVTAALRALRSFLYSDMDEIYLDRLHDWYDDKVPTLVPPPTDIQDTKELKDHELAQIDAVAAALRTDIVLRIRYILKEMHLPPIGVTSALDILIRLSRHSKTDALNIACTPYLLDSIAKNFIPLSTNILYENDVLKNIYGTPVIQALRLCRILVSYAGKPVAHRLENLGIVHSIISYISSDTGKNYGVYLNIEALRLWKLILHHKVALDSITGAQIVLCTQLQLLLCQRDIGDTSELACEYASALILLSSNEPSLKHQICTLLSKWSTQLATDSAPTWGTTKLVAQTLKTVKDIRSFNTSWISNELIFKHLCSSSNLLSNLTLALNREPTCLPNLNVITDEGLLPILSSNCHIPFLATVIDFLFNCSLITEIEKIFNQPTFHKYLNKLQSVSWSLERSWFSRLELQLLVAIVKASTLITKGLEIKTQQTIWKITIKLISALPSDMSTEVKQMLRIALSNEKLKIEGISNDLTDLKLDDNVQNIKIGCESNINFIYEKFLNPYGTWDQAAMPKDWLYLPLVSIYTNYKKNIPCKNEAQEKGNILAVLNLELMLPEITSELSSNLRFSRLVLIYLSDTWYLTPDISYLLSQVTQNLLKNHYNQLDFTATIPGISSFTDIFTAMCEQFCSSSYGDDNFAMTLLIPIAQRHDVHYRKLLWSEHAGTLRFIRLPIEKLVISVNEYLYPEEEDTSLIESYLTCLVRKVIRKEWCPIPHLIALHHSAMYLKRTTKLALRMRSKVEQIPDKIISFELLNYEPPKYD